MTTSWELREPSADLADSYRAAGYWTDDSLGDLIADALAAIPAERELRIWSETRPARERIDEVAGAARRFAAWLSSTGVAPGDVVAFQLPNQIEAAIVFWGAALAGAVVTPVVHFYGEAEVRFILEQSRPRVFVTVDETWLELVGEVGGCRLVCVETSVPARSLRATLEGAPCDGPVAVDPAAPAILAYTSGTTASPKGVIHTHRSFVSEMRQIVAVDPPDPRPSLIGAPVGHVMGMMSGLLLPIIARQSIHLTDRWDPAAVLDAMRRADLRFSGGSTYFLTSLLDSPALQPDDLDLLRYAGLGGSPVPVAVGERAEALGVTVFRVYGSTEHPTVTHGRLGPDPRRYQTDGYVLPGVELRIVSADGADHPPGEAGEIVTRGPDLFAGYTDPALTASVFDDDGWYHTGDVGVVDDGWLRVTDRIQDIIIRGGENVSAAEVEEAMARMPSVGEVALVAAPDERLGEHGCAFVLPRPGQPPPDLAAVRDHLAAVGLARQKWPEEVRVVSELPRTPSGKVKKFELRDQLRQR